MSSESFYLFKSSQHSLFSRARMRWIEWSIAVLFIISLLIGSGIFIEASNAADVKVKNYGGIVLDPQAVIPGTIHSDHVQKAENSLPALDDSLDMEDNSCELKP